ncbi:MAG TPA: TonB-dependent receptor [Caulobacteraceae bacterium]|jgi:iron complex outermembrane receptor protein
MTSTFKGALLVSAVWGLLAQAQTAAAAPPATAADASVTTLGDVVVTARRRAENLKDVPIAVTVFSAKKLDVAGVQDITALQQSTPNMTMQVARGSNSTTTAYIRGIGQQDPLWGFEPGVGLYIDDVYIARPQGTVLDIYNVDHIEVLRGPQGSLYGRNTIGGAVKYVTADLPSEATFDVKGQYGSYNERDGFFTGSTPVGDMIRVGVGAEISQHDGYGKNLLTGSANYNKDVNAERMTVEFRPTDKLFFRAAGDLFEDNSNARQGHREVAGDNGPAQGAAALPVTSNPYDDYSGMSPKNKVTNSGVSFLAQYEANDTLTLKSITASRHGSTRTNIDFADVPGPEFQVPGRYNDSQFSQELQALYTGKRLKGVLGVYYFDALSGGDADAILGNLGLTLNFHGNVTTKSIAGFGDFSYDLTDRLQISAGVRWTQDKRDGFVYRYFELGLGSPEFGGNGVALPPGAPGIGPNPRTDYTNSHTFSDATPRVSVSFKLTPDITSYASYSEGFKAGGFDMRGDAYLSPQTVNGYGPEYVTSYEAGLKGSFFDRRLDLSTAIYYADYTNMQVTVQVAATPPAIGIASVVDNAGKSQIDGFELEGHAAPGGPFSANFSLGLTDANFVHTPQLEASLIDVFQNAPKWNGYFQLAYTAPQAILDGHFIASASASYRSKTYQYSFAIPQIDQPAYTLVDLNAVWTSNSKHWEVGLHGLNVGDVRYRTGGYYFPGAWPSSIYGNTVTAFYGNPQTFLVSLKYKY